MRRQNACATMWLLLSVVLGCGAPTLPASESCNPSTNAPLTYLGLEGHSITALAESPWGIYAGTRLGGLFRCSVETGNRWTAVGLDQSIPTDILFLPGPPSRLLVSVRNRAAEQTAAAVFASEDGGETWLPWDGGLAARHGNNQWAYSLAVDPANPERLFMGQSASILRSVDGGRTWAFVYGSADLMGQGVDAIVIDPLTGRVFAAATSALSVGSVRFSIDHGDTWKVVLPGGASENGVFSLTIDHAHGGSVFIGQYGRVLRSTDEGESWHGALSHPDFMVTSVITHGGSVYAVGGHVAESPSAAARFMVFQSDDGGNTWHEVTLPRDIGGSDVATVDARGRLLIGTTARSGGGVWRLEP